MSAPRFLTWDMQDHIHSGKSYKRVTKPLWARFSTFSTMFSTNDYVNCGQRKYAKVVYIKSVKKFFSGIFHENIWDTQRGKSLGRRRMSFFGV